jgi:hypothetical protein
MNGSIIMWSSNEPRPSREDDGEPIHTLLGFGSLEKGVSKMVISYRGASASWSDFALEADSAICGDTRVEKINWCCSYLNENSPAMTNWSRGRE